jgi:hypothetical protein
MDAGDVKQATVIQGQSNVLVDATEAEIDPSDLNFEDMASPTAVPAEPTSTPPKADHTDEVVTHLALDERDESAFVPPSLSPDEVDNERLVSEEASSNEAEGGDVFGPTGIAPIRKGKRKMRRTLPAVPALVNPGTLPPLVLA